MRERTPSAMRPSLRRRLHRRLRGRYWLVLLAVLVGVAAGGIFGWRSTKPLYRATGSLYVQPSASDLRHASDPTQPSRLETFVASQVEMLGTGDVTRRAVETEAWQGAGGQVDEASIRAFEQGRTVLRVPGTHVIQVAFVDLDPDRAVGGVHALIEAYQAQFAELHTEEEEGTDTGDQEKTLVRQLRQGIETLQALTSEYGGKEGLEIHHRASVRQVMATEDALRTLRREITRATSDGATELESRPLTAHEIAVESEPMAEYLLQLAVAEAREKIFARRVGYDPLKVLALRDRIDVLQKGVDDLAEAWNRNRDDDGASGAVLSELTVREKRLEDRLEELRVRSTTLGQLHGEAKKLKEANEGLDRQLIQLEAVEEQLASRPGGRGRVQVADPGMRPTSPYQDERRLRAAIGAAAGALLAFLLVLLLSLGSRRLGSAVSADDVLRQVRSLGLLPALPTDWGDSETARVAAHLTHQIRTLLEIAHARDEHACICITGPSAGSGKTTLTSALGLSFASTGSRTLLVDADPTDGDLSRNVIHMLACHVERAAAADDADDSQAGLLQPIGDGALSAAAASPEVLERLLTKVVAGHGLHGARDAGLVLDLFSLADLLDAGQARDRLALKLMKTLASEGELASGTPAAWIPARTRDVGHPGELLDEALLEQHLHRTGIDGLRFLPLHGVGRENTSSVAMMGGILGCLRDHFDVVLVDAGSVPGTNETAFMAVQSDSTVLVVSPQDQGPDAERALAYLAEIGARVTGVVFNRADEKDIVATGRTMYVGSREQRGG